MYIIQLFVSRPFRGISRRAIVLTAAASIGTIERVVFFFFLYDSAPPTFGLFLFAICLKNIRNSYGKFYILNIIHTHTQALRFILTAQRQYSNISLFVFIVKCDACTWVVRGCNYTAYVHLYHLTVCIYGHSFF